MQRTPVTQIMKEKFTELVEKNNLADEAIRVTIGTLTPDQAIGKPMRTDFALLGGKEVMIEAQFRDSYGQAFTNQPQEYSGSLKDVLNLDLNTVNNRAVFIATFNAVCAAFGLAEKTRHCRNEELEECGQTIANTLLDRFGKVKIGMVGFQPAILAHLVQAFGTDNIRCNDLDPRNIGSNKSGIILGDGSRDNKDMIDWCDVLFGTSSTNVNDTFQELSDYAVSLNKPFLTFGVTGSGITAFTGIEIICPCGH